MTKRSSRSTGARNRKSGKAPGEAASKNIGRRTSGKRNLSDQRAVANHPPGDFEIQALARFAVDDNLSNDDKKARKEFRKNACNRNTFKKTFEAALTSHPGELLKLDPDQINFCEGWAYLAAQTFSGKDFDTKLVAAIKAHLTMSKEEYGPKSG